MSCQHGFLGGDDGGEILRNVSRRMYSIRVRLLRIRHQRLSLKSLRKQSHVDMLVLPTSSSSGAGAVYVTSSPRTPYGQALGRTTVP